MELERMEKKGMGVVPLAFLIITLAGYAAGIGYNMATINENTRRIQAVEQRSDSFMSKEDASDIKRRLEKIDEKVDRISARQARGN